MNEPPSSHLAELTLSHFRSHKFLNIHFPPKPSPVILLGENGVGKTNLLEALSLFMCGTRTLRGAPLEEMIQRDHVQANVFARINTPVVELRLQTSLLRKEPHSAIKRTYRCNEREERSFGGLGEHLHIAWQTPDMDQMLLSPSAPKRKYFDHLVDGLFQGHMRLFHGYETLQRQRAHLLMQGSRDARFLSVLESRMSERALTLAKQRLLFASNIQDMLFVVHIGENAPLLTYNGLMEDLLPEKGEELAKTLFQERLQSNREKDKQSGKTHEGANRFSWTLHHETKRIPAHFCSCGEVKRLLLSLLLAYANLVHQKSACFLLLLDDVMSHLDHKNRRRLLAQLEKLSLQPLFTGTNEKDFVDFDGFFLRLEN